MKWGYLVVLLVLFFAGVGILATRTDNNIPQSQNDAVVEGEGRSTVAYLETGFSPSRLTVEVGTEVNFINETDKPMWVASDPHPVHTDYSAFDQLSTGEGFSYTFEEAGTYLYHNHMVPKDTGVVVVE